MGLIFLIISLSLIGFVAIKYKGDSYMWSNIKLTTIICMGISIAVMTIVYSQSYINYLTLKEIQIIVPQQAKGISLYVKKGIREFKSKDRAATDIKYNSYQTEMAKMIHGLQKNINIHNGLLVKKRILKRTWVWKRFVCLPPGEKLLDITDYIK